MYNTRILLLHLTYGHTMFQSGSAHHHAKFGHDSLKHCRDMVILYFQNGGHPLSSVIEKFEFDISTFVHGL